MGCKTSRAKVLLYMQTNTSHSDTPDPNYLSNLYVAENLFNDFNAHFPVIMSVDLIKYRESAFTSFDKIGPWGRIWHYRVLLVELHRMRRTNY